MEKMDKVNTAGSTSKEVAEGRYIKGDPLKGYYDFVITEGSYKFWAIFQVFILLLSGQIELCPNFCQQSSSTNWKYVCPTLIPQLATAALIIYSTFAAIYYSKVNPLTSDYDYVDYFGGRSLGSGRSLDTGDEDNVDIDVDTDPETGSQTSASSRSESTSSSLFSGWSSIFQTDSYKWLGTAAHSFDFVLDAIDKVPQ